MQDLQGFSFNYHWYHGNVMRKRLDSEGFEKTVDSSDFQNDRPRGKPNFVILINVLLAENWQVKVLPDVLRVERRGPAS